MQTAAVRMTHRGQEVIVDRFRWLDDQAPMVVGEKERESLLALASEGQEVHSSGTRILVPFWQQNESTCKAAHDRSLMPPIKSQLQYYTYRLMDSL